MLTEDKALITQAIQALAKVNIPLYTIRLSRVTALESQSGQRIVVLITDGKDTGMGIFKSADAMQELSGIHSHYPMGFGNNVNANDLRKWRNYWVEARKSAQCA